MKHLLAISWLFLSQADYTSGKLCQDQQLIPGELDMYSPCVETFDSYFGDLATNTTSTIDDFNEPLPLETTEATVFVKDASLTYAEGSIFKQLSEAAIKYRT